MGQASKFNDARVLRSDETSLLKDELHVLMNNITQGDNDFDDLRKLESIWTKFNNASSGYIEQADEVRDVFDTALRTYDSQSPELRLAGKAIYDFAMSAGQEQFDDVILRMSEYEFIKTRWTKNTKLIASTDMRKKLLRIYDAVVNAKGVRFMGAAKQAWVEGEPEPLVKPQADTIEPESATTVAAI